MRPRWFDNGGVLGERRQRRSPGCARTGWTIVELLVVIGVITVLLSIVLPALFNARMASRQGKSAANARTLLISILGYADTHKERFPIGEVDALYATTGRQNLISLPSWYENVYMWPGVVYDSLPFDENVEVYLSPLGNYPGSKSLVWPTSYLYSSSFIGDPRIWSSGFVSDATHLRAVAISEVTTPSGKALLWDNEFGIARTPGGYNLSGGMPQTVSVPIGFADASVRAKQLGASRSPFWATISGGPAIPPLRLCNTEDGVRGADY